MIYKIYNEAIPLNLAKKYMKISGGKYKTLYPEIFKDGKDRQYYKYNKILDVEDSPIYPLIKDYLDGQGYEIIDYKKGLAKDVSGKVDKSGKQQFRIGKLLKVNSDLAKSFQEDPIRGSGGFKIVISRHPYDVAGMTSGRAWYKTSCMNLTSGCNRHYVEEDIVEGTLVAYLINKGDENIEQPYARVLIKPYVSDDGDRALGVSKQVYGIRDEDFKKDVEKIIKEFNGELTKAYKFNKRLYRDYDPQFLGRDSGRDIEVVYADREGMFGRDDELLSIIRINGWYGIGYSTYDHESDEYVVTEIVIEPEYDEISNLNQGEFINEHSYLYIEKRGKHGILEIFPDIMEVIPCEYDWIQQFDGYDITQVEKNGKYGILSNTFAEIVPCEYDIIYLEIMENGEYDAEEALHVKPLTIVSKNGYRGVIDVYENEIIVPCEFDYEDIININNDEKRIYVDGRVFDFDGNEKSINMNNTHGKNGDLIIVDSPDDGVYYRVFNLNTNDYENNIIYEDIEKVESWTTDDMNSVKEVIIYKLMISENNTFDILTATGKLQGHYTTKTKKSLDQREDTDGENYFIVYKDGVERKLNGKGNLLKLKD